MVFKERYRLKDGGSVIFDWVFKHQTKRIILDKALESPTKGQVFLYDSRTQQRGKRIKNIEAIVAAL